MFAGRTLGDQRHGIGQGPAQTQAGHQTQQHQLRDAVGEGGQQGAAAEQGHADNHGAAATEAVAEGAEQ